MTERAKMVPREPTQEMIEEVCGDESWPPNFYRDIWRAMFDAAPPPAEPSAEPHKPWDYDAQEVAERAKMSRAGLDARFATPAPTADLCARLYALQVPAGAGSMLNAALREAASALEAMQAELAQVRMSLLASQAGLFSRTVARAEAAEAERDRLREDFKDQMARTQRAMAGKEAAEARARELEQDAGRMREMFAAAVYETDGITISGYALVVAPRLVLTREETQEGPRFTAAIDAAMGKQEGR